ncbi:[FeFe] hydrogenase H-cluster maturation GTPase HydF [Desulfovibrio psychrotolerans]|uniref:[FeFe] hydrogenase H-cluster maturation GTPase HydF n=1 Tax=Desulfovibrio psychrotolerans TaxID=415242 RepID=A0A7J0BVQ6_9BACT|nr:[FeFe] hydrogenase H-cluster maturation GTPase HydF [Desulfovibrio psychrotolerans]GFM37245.1 [FeFe] hydrogenase H-cluster maturation GTPase HydF [Desulfovibrio psychrotolerans]
MTGKAPRGVRMVITLVGRRNAGKSSLINALTGQDIAIVSDHPGTTTDPVAKHYELLPIGPVTFYDTAGLDDTGELGAMRIHATRKVLCRTDLALLVAGETGLGDAERDILKELAALDIPFAVVFNKADMTSPRDEDIRFCADSNIRYVSVSARPGGQNGPAGGADAVKQLLLAAAPPEYLEEPALVADMVQAGDSVLCVVPIDLAAPKGRLILPQVQVLREVLDCDAMATVVKERELEEALLAMRRDPALVVTDSQAILKVAGDVPDHIPLTTFSTLFARYKGDIAALAHGAHAIDTLRDHDRILMCEACSHHAVADDIGRVKIPRWLRQYTGKELEFSFYAGHDFPDNLEGYALAVHCGGCMTNRAEMLRRIRECTRRGVPITNYGIAISKVQGVLERVLRPLGIHPHERG